MQMEYGQAEGQTSLNPFMNQVSFYETYRRDLCLPPPRLNPFMNQVSFYALRPEDNAAALIES